MKQFWMLAGALMLAGAAKADFASDVDFLKKHTDVLVLSDKSGDMQVAVVPQYQGRVMTSSASGVNGDSFGWMNYKLIQDGKRQPHINAFGGEDRFWLGPEGGQYSVFFPKGKAFEFANWNTPEPIDWGGWVLLGFAREHARFSKTFKITNYQGTEFTVRAQRSVRLLEPDQIQTALGVLPNKNLQMVAFETDNNITNAGTEAWTKKGGLLSIWILGMLNPSPYGTIVMPFVPGSEAKLGPVVNDAYFGKVPADRLRMDAAKGVLYFKADGKQRGKIGLPPRRAKNVLGSWDGRTLTIVDFTLPTPPQEYVNSMWEVQKSPFGGDVSNAYNDGPLADGGQLGPFYELESSSPAVALKPNESVQHVHRTFHLQGSKDQLDRVARFKLGVSLDEIQNALAK